MNSYEKTIWIIPTLMLVCMIISIFLIIKEYRKSLKFNKNIEVEFHELLKLVNNSTASKEKVLEFINKASIQNRMALALQMAQFYITKN